MRIFRLFIRFYFLCFAGFTLAQSVACKGESPPVRRVDPASAQRLGQKTPVAKKVAALAKVETCSIALRPLRNPSAKRVVAIGDLHGDLSATRQALRLAGAINENDSWIGGALVLVQTGDILDRGDDEQEILDLFTRLTVQAQKAGGVIYRLNGNHELMNAMGDFRYVTRGGFQDFSDDPFIGTAPLTSKSRIKAFGPGGAYAKRLSEFDLVTMVGDSVFVHGGVLPQFVEELEAINRDARCFLSGERKQPPPAVVDPEGPLWTRVFSKGPEDCARLEASLAKLGAARMVVGHTPQLEGITSACDGKIWRIDTGMADFYGGPIEVLEIRGKSVRTLR